MADIQPNAIESVSAATLAAQLQHPGRGLNRQRKLWQTAEEKLEKEIKSMESDAEAAVSAAPAGETCAPNAAPLSLSITMTAVVRASQPAQRSVSGPTTCLSKPMCLAIEGAYKHRERVSSKPIASPDSFPNAQLGILDQKSRSSGLTQ